MLCIRILGRFAPSVFTLRAHIHGRFAPLAAFKFCLLHINLWLPSNFACHRAAFCCLQALLAIKQPWLPSSFACYKLRLLHSSPGLPSSFDCYTAAFGCLEAVLVKQQPSTAYTAAFGCLQALLAIQQPLAALKLCFLYSSLWLTSSFAI